MSNQTYKNNSANLSTPNKSNSKSNTSALTGTNNLLTTSHQKNITIKTQINHNPHLKTNKVIQIARIALLDKVQTIPIIAGRRVVATSAMKKMIKTT